MNEEKVRKASNIRLMKRILATASCSTMADMEQENCIPPSDCFKAMKRYAKLQTEAKDKRIKELEEALRELMEELRNNKRQPIQGEPI